MTSVIWLSDLHFTAQGLVQDHDPRRRLSLVVDHINAHFSDAQYCVISGDLVDRGNTEDYRALRAALDGLAVPYLPMMGNHDDRALMRALLPLPEGGMADFVQYAVEADEALLICLDTHRPGAAAGSFCQARLGWLADALAGNRGQPAIIFMHHPPMDLGLPMQDQDRLQDSGPLLELLASQSSVRQLCIGHVHRPITGTVRGIPFATMRSVLYQAPPPEPAWNWDNFAPAVEAPAFGVLRVSAGDVRLQYTQFCDYADGVTSGGR